MAAVLTMLLAACALGPGPAGVPCDSDGARSTCLAPSWPEEHYVEASEQYFDTMDATVPLETWPPYSVLVARWEWPPWLKLTAFGRDDIIASDTLLRLFPSTVPERDCRAFEVQPFGRCQVVFYYDAHEGLGCPIYEEFTFNDRGEITFIEAWSDVEGLSPTSVQDPWGEQEIPRLSTRVPGLGNDEGRPDLDSPWMLAAAAADADLADFVTRARDWQTAWAAEYAAAGDDYWARGCGW